MAGSIYQAGTNGEDGSTFNSMGSWGNKCMDLILKEAFLLVNHFETSLT